VGGGRGQKLTITKEKGVKKEGSISSGIKKWFCMGEKGIRGAGGRGKGMAKERDRDQRQYYSLILERQKGRTVNHPGPLRERNRAIKKQISKLRKVDSERIQSKAGGNWRGDKRVTREKKKTKGDSPRTNRGKQKKKTNLHPHEDT